MDPDLRALHQRAQLGVLCSLDFFHMAFAIRPGVDTVDAHTTPRCQCVVVRQPQTSPWGSATTLAMTTAQAVYHHPWLRRRPGHVVVVAQRHGGGTICGRMLHVMR